MDAAQLAGLIDHTLLTPEATPTQVAALCRDATRFAVAAVCLSPSRLPLPAGLLDGRVAVATVCGFPSGAHHPAVKAAEAALAVGHGADEVDVVIDLGAVVAGEWGVVTAGLSSVRASVPAPARLKVIVESAVLDAGQLVRACEAAEEAGADFVKTSTGFHPAGGATVEAVRLMAATVGGRLGVKASGGIRTRDAALAMVDAGATRLGTSATAAILGS
jgi:deoxyribose-phosphate aldolase